VVSVPGVGGLIPDYNLLRISVNMSKSSKLIDELEHITGEPLGNYYLKTSEVNAILNTKLNVGIKAKS
jgi:hypothetical protein